MSIENWKFYSVKCELSWMKGSDSHSADVRINIYAKSTGHAISRAKDALANIGMHVVEDVTAKEIDTPEATR